MGHLHDRHYDARQEPQEINSAPLNPQGLTPNCEVFGAIRGLILSLRNRPRRTNPTLSFC